VASTLIEFISTALSDRHFDHPPIWSIITDEKLTAFRRL
jgi:hypothetical protein